MYIFFLCISLSPYLCAFFLIEKPYFSLPDYSALPYSVLKSLLLLLLFSFPFFSVPGNLMDVDDRSMDMMAMMMQMEKFPEFSEPFYPEPQFSTTSTTSLPILPNNLINPPPSFVTNNINPIPPLMTIPHLQPKDVGVRITDNVPNASSSEKKNSMAAMREMIFRIAVMQPIHIDPESIKPPKRRNVKISKDPQSVAARHRRERISERIRILQRLVPGGTKMDTASMLDEAIHYVKFLKKQVQTLEQAGASRAVGFGVPSINMNNNYSTFMKGYHQPSQMVGSSMQMLS